MKKTIENATLNTFDNIVELCNELNKNAPLDSIPELLTQKINAYNENAIYNGALKLLTDNAKDFYKSIICIDTATPYTAISTDIVKISLTDSGNLQATSIEKALTFSDFYNAKIKLLATAHADKKATKDDRATATQYFFGKNGYGLIQCLVYTASNAQKLDGATLKKSADLLQAYTTIRDEYTASGKENPFDGDSGNKRTKQINRVISEFVDGIQCTKYHFDAFAQIVATTNRKGVFVIDTINNSMQALILIARHAYNKIQFTIKDKARILDNGKKTK